MMLVVLWWSAASFLGHLHATKYCLPTALELAFSSTTAVVIKTSFKNDLRAELCILESMDEIVAPKLVYKSIAVAIEGAAAPPGAICDDEGKGVLPAN